jgi:hypothetical protein
MNMTAMAAMTARLRLQLYSFMRIVLHHFLLRRPLRDGRRTADGRGAAE